jgi:hypothetical protein
MIMQSIKKTGFNGDDRPDLQDDKCSFTSGFLFMNLLFFLSLVTVTVKAQTITSFTPVSGPTGSQGSTTITITGTGFNTTAANNVIFFGAVSAIPSAATATSITVTVPAGATYQYLSVLNKGTNLKATAYSQEPFIPTFYNEGAMQFSGNTDYSFSYASTKPYFKVGDIDGDGKPDVVLLNVAANSVSVLRNTSAPGSLSFASAMNITTGTTPKCIVIDDMDGDGKPDLVVGNSGDQKFSVMLNTSTSGSISFAAKTDFASGSASAVDEMGVADYDGDGKPDIIYLTINGAGSLMKFMLNTSTIGSPGFSGSGADPLNFPKNIIFTDFDKDGKVDWAIASTSTGVAKLYRNNSIPGTLLLGTSFTITAGSGPAWLATGDLDGDGKADMVSTNTGGTNIATMLNTSSPGTLNLNTRVGTNIATTPSCLVITDLDGDGKPDIASLGKGNSTVNIFRNNAVPGTITLGAKVSLSTISSPDFFSFCDFDGDGKPDMAVANSSTFLIQKSVSKAAPLFIGRIAF